MGLRAAIVIGSVLFGVAHAEPIDLDALADRLETTRLNFEHAVAADGLELPLAYGSLVLHDGILVPAAIADDDRSFELVFIGSGRLRVNSPDVVEAQQVALFTGRRNLDTGLDRVVLIFGDPARVAAILDNDSVVVDPEVRTTAERLYHDWVVRAERHGFGADGALLRTLVDDPVARGFLGAWLHSPALGWLYYSDDPSEREAVSLGRYTLFSEEDLKTRYEKRDDRQIARNKKKLERKLGRSLDDFFDDPEEEDEDECAVDGDKKEQDEDTDGEDITIMEEWLRAARPGEGLESMRSAIEPEHYRIELSMEGPDLDARGTATIRLRPTADGLNIVTFSLTDKLDVCEVLDQDGQPLVYRRQDAVLTVLLARPTTASRPFELTVNYAGKPVVQWHDRRSLRSTTRWHPHTGIYDRATYDVTLRWPRDLVLLASGRPVEQGSDESQRWTRNVFDIPIGWFSFEVGDLIVVQDHVGHMDLTFGFHRRDSEMTDEIRNEIIKTVKASILFFESQLGRLPIDRLTVTIVDRAVSQGLLGFVTLSENGMHYVVDRSSDSRTSQEVRLELISHEISHQWWGNMVGWESYRDQWLSEALASFSSATFMGKIATRPELYHRKNAELWRNALQARTLDGKPVASLGPVVLGRRLRDHQWGWAYHAIVYDKGAAVFSTLAQRIGSDPMWQMLGSLARTVGNRVISTSTFFKAMERMLGQELDGFVRQYVHGTGMPALFYEYRTRPNPSGGWVIEGEVRQMPAEQFRLVLRKIDTGWDVTRQNATIEDVAGWTNVVPFHVETEGPDPDGSRGAVEGKLTISGASSKFSIPVDRRPRGFELDPHGQILAEFHAEEFEPKRYLFELGEHLGKLGLVEAGLTTLARALEAQGSIPTEMLSSKGRATEDPIRLDVRAHLARARLLLDLGDDDSAQQELRAIKNLLPRDSNYYEGERMVLATRIDLRRGRDRLALDRLNDYLSEHILELDWFDEDQLLDATGVTALKINRGEVLALLAVASHEMQSGDSAWLVLQADEAGIDMRALSGPGR